MHRRRSSQSGFAIFMVIMMSLILSAFVAIMWTMAGSAEPVRELVTERAQAEYLARGAQQHFLLKFRYLPTELYDAVAYSIGKNPYYDFGREHDPLDGSELADENAKVNPGPMFYFGNVTVDLDGNGIPVITRDVDLNNPPGTDGDRIRALLRMYLLDVGTLYPTNDENSAIVVVSSNPRDDHAMGAGWRDPFIGNYAVQNATILGLAGGKRYDRDSLLVSTVGSVRRSDQISLVSAGSVDGLRNLSGGMRTVRELSFGVHEFPEAATYLEDVARYEARMADDDENTNVVPLGLSGVGISSGRRTDVATGIYRISREH